jgi:hypothetical protein
MTDGADVADLPTWLPPLVKEQACLAYGKAATPADTDIVRRITTHGDMKRVWKELLKRRRDGSYQKTDDYVHPVLNTAPSDWLLAAADPLLLAHTEGRQQLGLARFYISVVDIAQHSTRPDEGMRICRQEIEQIEGQVRRLAALTARFARRSDLWFEQVDDADGRILAIEHLLQAARCLSGWPDQYEADNAWMIPKLVVSGITSRLEQLFGASMYGHAAIVAGIVLQQEISLGYVRGVVGPLKQPPTVL